MAKVLEVTAARLIHGIFVCRKCKTKLRTSMHRILKGKVKCRKCAGKAFRPIKKGK